MNLYMHTEKNDGKTNKELKCDWTKIYQQINKWIQNADCNPLILKLRSNRPGRTGVMRISELVENFNIFKILSDESSWSQPHQLL
jgi:SMC interacting uncharacterized protein involved in chromosome segregation